jgi:hypothetical protein
MESVARSPPVPSGETRRSSSAGTTAAGPSFTRDRHDRHDRAGMPDGTGHDGRKPPLQTGGSTVRDRRYRGRRHAAAAGRAACLPHGNPRLRASVSLADRRRLARSRHPGGQPNNRHAAAAGRAACLPHGNPRLRASVSLADLRRLARARHPGGQPNNRHAAAAGRAACLAPGVVRLDAASSRHAAAAPRRPRSPGGATARHASRTSGCGSACPRLPGPWMARQP